MALLEEGPLNLKEFDDIIKYLLEEKFITKNGESFTLTEDGRKRVDKIFKKSDICKASENR